MQFFNRSSALAAVTACMFGATAAWAGPALKSAHGGQVRALLVGIDKYASITQLDGAVADMRDIERALKKSGVPAGNIKALPDLEATRVAFVGAMEKLVADSASGDLAIISFSGHGMRVPANDLWKKYEGTDGLSEEFVLANYKNSGPGTQEGVMNKEMKAWLARLDAKNVDVIFVADTCHGGGLARSVSLDAPTMKIRETKDRPKEGENKFVPIKMTEKEMATNVQDLAHVSFLAGADRKHVVPEVTINGKPRGALSYAFAQAIEGNAVDKGIAVTTRGQLFQYALQIVQQQSKEQQLIDYLPTRAEPKAFEVPVFRSADGGTPDPIPVPVPAPMIKVFVLNGTAAALNGVKAITAFAVTANKDEAELIWDVAGQKIISHQGDAIAEHVTAQNLGGTIDRTFAISGIDALSLKQVQAISLKDGGKLYTPRDTPVIVASGLLNQFLVIFNIAGNGQLQMLTPELSGSGKIDKENWTYQPSVTQPFGEDRVVAVSSPVALPGLVEWLWAHNQQPAAALVPEKLAAVIAANKGVRIGTVGLFTQP